MNTGKKTELRVELNADEVSVLDGYCAGSGQERTKVIREILKEWSAKQWHISTMVLRVAGRNPALSEGDRE